MFKSKNKEETIEKTIDNLEGFFQNIYLTLSDGRVIAASVPAFCLKDEEITALTISKLQISRPMKLPENSKFEKIG